MQCDVRSLVPHHDPSGPAVTRRRSWRVRVSHAQIEYCQGSSTIDSSSGYTFSLSDARLTLRGGFDWSLSPFPGAPSLSFVVFVINRVLFLPELLAGLEHVSRPFLAGEEDD